MHKRKGKGIRANIGKWLHRVRVYSSLPSHSIWLISLFETIFLYSPLLLYLAKWNVTQQSMYMILMHVRMKRNPLYYDFLLLFKSLLYMQTYIFSFSFSHFPHKRGTQLFIIIRMSFMRETVNIFRNCDHIFPFRLIMQEERKFLA